LLLQVLKSIACSREDVKGVDARPVIGPYGTRFSWHCTTRFKLV
jgi:hypothetical protein